MSNSRTIAVLAAHWLEFAGFKVDCYNDILSVIIDGKRFFTNIHGGLEFGLSFVNYEIIVCFNVPKAIILRFDDVEECGILLNSTGVFIRGEEYIVPNYLNIYIGRIYGNMFHSYTDTNTIIPLRAFKPNPEPDYLDVDIIPPEIGENDILSAIDLTPAKPQPINVMNEGVKLVKYVPITSDVEEFTVIGTYDHKQCIVDGKFTEIDNGPFKYEKGGEQFMLLVNEATDESCLASERRVIKLKSTDTYLVKPENGLYLNYRVLNDPKTLSCFEDDEGDYADYEGNPTEVPVPCVYCYNYILFGFYIKNDKCVILDVDNPTGGMNTKPAFHDAN